MLLLVIRSDVLVEEDWITLGIKSAKLAVRSALIGFARQLDTLRLELALQLAHICESVERLCIAIPTRIESEDVLFKHPLK